MTLRKVLANNYAWLIKNFFLTFGDARNGVRGFRFSTLIFISFASMCGRCRIPRVCVVKRAKHLALSHQVLLMSSVRSGINSFWACQVGHTHHCGLECMIPVDCVTSPIIWTLVIAIILDFAVHGEALRPASGNPFDANISNNDAAAS